MGAGRIVYPAPHSNELLRKHRHLCAALCTQLCELDTANLLCDHLRARLPGLISRYQEDWQQEHSVWDVVRENIPTCAAIKVVIGHCKRLQDLRCCGMDDQLFVNDTTRFKPMPEQKYAPVGSYLFYTDK